MPVIKFVRLLLEHDSDLISHCSSSLDTPIVRALLSWSFIEFAYSENLKAFSKYGDIESLSQVVCTQRDPACSHSAVVPESVSDQLA